MSLRNNRRGAIDFATALVGPPTLAFAISYACGKMGVDTFTGLARDVDSAAERLYNFFKQKIYA